VSIQRLGLIPAITDLSPSLSETISKIVVPVDGSDASIRAGNTAVMLAAKYGSSVIAIHVTNIDQYLQSFGLYRLSYPDPVKKRIQESELEAQNWFAKLKNVADQHNVKFENKLIDSSLSVVAAIIEFAENQKVELIVVGTRGRTGFSKLLLGSVANGIVTYANCPVLVVR
jgi:nucleotide-binding universal stress UspA family protein